ncbi:MAG: ethylbenzene dehydrogenase-related protein [Nitrospinaceae bacterium]|nr:ethylbenzene dehydrogenase-related protein [Nitrospinaceae bacterium]
MEPFSKVLTNNRSKDFFLSALTIILFLLFIPNYALSQGEHEHHGDKTPSPGSEYRVEEKPMEHHHHDDGGGDPFRTRGSHSDLGAKKPEAMQEEGLLARGRNIYLHMCVFCHGKDGNGGGTATDYLYPWPRDFRMGIFKFRSTPTDTLPRDEDLYRTIIKGIPGTSMPAWGDALSAQDTWALINLIKNFSPRFSKEPQGKKITINEPPQVTPQLIARGKELFTKHKCDACHGQSLRGDGRLAESLLDAWKHAVFVQDITVPGYYKGGFEAKDIFRTVSTGLDGTPMSSYAHLPEQDRWALVHYIRSQFTREFKKAEFETDVYSFRKDFELNTDVNSPIWDGVKSTNLVLRPLAARRDAIEVINFASVNNGEQLAVRLKWEDPTKNTFSELNQDYFRDGVAVQFALGNVTLHTHGHNEPFFGMGNRGKPVNIWHWKSGLEETLEAEGDQEYAGDVDMDALIFGGVMSNPVAKLNLTSENAVEELNAEGFGTITPQPADKQNVEGYGEWKDGVWTVVFLRDMLKTGKWDTGFIRKDPTLVALAVWDGIKEDRNGRKVISVWQRLSILDK